MHIPISFRDDRQRAEEIILKAVRDNTQEIANLAKPELERLKERFFIESADIPPRVYLRITDNWVELAVRFLCPTHDIRDLKSRIGRQILAGLDEAKIGIASSTYDVVGLPPIRVEGPIQIATDGANRSSSQR
jgi:small-conductance mechanosensitive channel